MNGDIQMSEGAFAGDVRARRVALGLRQEDVADLAGVSVRFLRSLEQGKATVRLDKVSAVLETLGLELRAELRGTRPLP